MDRVPVTVAGELELDYDALPTSALQLVKSALTVPNEDREKKLANKVWGAWNEPEFFELWRQEHRRDGTHKLLLPRGFAANLVVGLRSQKIEVEWDDQRVSAAAEPGYFKPFVLRDYQLTAVMKLMVAEQGFYQCPAGGGKSVTLLGLFAHLQQRALLIVDKMALLYQWRDKAMDPRFLGLTEDQVGIIGDDVWEERDFTICMRQTLHSRGWQTTATDWFDKWGVVYFDEGHHLSAETVQDICRQCRSKYLGGVSATPEKSETRGRIVYSLVGPKVAETTRKELYERQVLIEPTVRVVYTGHDDIFWPTHDVIATQTCQVPNCRKNGTDHGHLNNWSSCLKTLVEDKGRAALIASEVVKERGHVHLINTGQLKHITILKKAIINAGWDGPIYELKGEENAEGLSQPIAEAIADGGFWETYDAKEKNPKTGRMIKVTRMRKVSDDVPHGREAIILSTVADEGLDIPPIDRVHLTFPMRQEGAVIQVIGRGERIASGKTDSVIVDYRDRCIVFAEQALERDRVFRSIGYRVEERSYA